MCGIVGYISKHENAFKSEREKFLIEALVMDTLRGWDSTGILWLEKDFDVGMMRTTQPGPQFVRNKKFLETDWNGWAAIGHNRAATHGSVKVSNAHPFNYGPITLVHNGTVSNWRNGLIHANPKIEVDSAMIAYNLSKVEPDEANNVLKLINGSYALVWVDTRDQSINMVRNGSRPLHVGQCNSKSLMFFMSEAGMLRSLSDRQRNNSTKIDTIYQVETHKHLKFKKGSLVPEVTTVDPFVAPRSSSASQTHGRTCGTHSAGSRRNAERESLWEEAMRKGSTSSEGTGDNISLFTSDERTWRNGQHQPLDPILMSFVDKFYCLDSHTRVSFTPTEYVEWDDTHGMVRGTIRHPLWGYTDWEACVYHFPKSWVKDERMSAEWTVSAIGVVPAWFGNSRTTLPPLMVQVRNFEWRGFNSDEEEEQWTSAATLRTDYDDEEAPWESEEERKERTLAEASDKDVGVELFWGPDDKLIWREQLQGLLEYGCCGCQGNLTEDDHEDIMWVGMHGNQPLCYDCQNMYTDPDFDMSEEQIH